MLPWCVSALFGDYALGLKSVSSHAFVSAEKMIFVWLLDVMRVMERCTLRLIFNKGIKIVCLKNSVCWLLLAIGCIFTSSPTISRHAVVDYNFVINSGTKPFTRLLEGYGQLLKDNSLWSFFVRSSLEALLCSRSGMVLWDVTKVCGSR